MSRRLTIQEAAKPELILAQSSTARPSPSPVSAGRTSAPVRVGAALVLLPLFFGVTAPSCGGTQALQQQIDQTVTQNQEQARLLQELQGQLKAMQSELGTVKALATQLGTTVLAQRQAIEQLQKSPPAKAPARSVAAVNGGRATGKKAAKPSQRRK